MQRGHHTREPAKPFTQDEIERRRHATIDPVEARWVATIDQAHAEIEQLSRELRAARTAMRAWGRD